MELVSINIVMYLSIKISSQGLVYKVGSFRKVIDDLKAKGPEYNVCMSKMCGMGLGSAHVVYFPRHNVHDLCKKLSRFHIFFL